MPPDIPDHGDGSSSAKLLRHQVFPLPPGHRHQGVPGEAGERLHRLSLRPGGRGAVRRILRGWVSQEVPQPEHVWRSEGRGPGDDS